MVAWQLAGLILGSTPQERIGPGLQVMVMGMTVVFVVLILLYGILTLIGLLGRAPSPGAGRLPPSGTRDTVPQAAEPPTPSEASVSAAEQTAPGTAEGNGPVLAAITAAIAVATASVGAESPAIGATRAACACPSWALAGRIELHSGRYSLPRSQAWGG